MEGPTAHQDSPRPVEMRFKAESPNSEDSDTDVESYPSDNPASFDDNQDQRQNNERIKMEIDDVGLNSTFNSDPNEMDDAEDGKAWITNHEMDSYEVQQNTSGPEMDTQDEEWTVKAVEQSSEDDDAQVDMSDAVPTGNTLKARHSSIDYIQEDEDIFFCGRCNTQFSSMMLYVEHKKSGCTSMREEPLVKPVALITAVRDESTVGSDDTEVGESPPGREEPTADDVASNLKMTFSNILTEARELTKVKPLESLKNSEEDCPNLILSVFSDDQTMLEGDGSEMRTAKPSSGKARKKGSSRKRKKVSGLESGSGLESDRALESGQNLKTGVKLESGSGLETGVHVGQSIAGLSGLGLESNVGLESGLGLAGLELETFLAQNIIKACSKRSKKSSKNIYECKICDVQYKSLKKFQKHNMIHALDQPLKCRYCDKLFASRSGRSRHEGKHKGIFECQVCFEAFTKRSDLTTHLRIVHGLRKNKKPGCTGRYVKPKASDVSMCDASGEQGLKSEAQATSNAHEKQESGSDVHKNLGNSNAENARGFESNADGSPGNSVAQNVGKSMANADVKVELAPDFDDYDVSTDEDCDLSKPASVTEGPKSQINEAKTGADNGNETEKGFKCKKCHQSFPTKEELVEHERPHKCDYCGKAYHTRSNFMRHPCARKKPEGDGQYFQCKYCNISFMSAHLLKNHERTHAESLVKEYPCEHCGKTFNKRRHLVLHIRTHTGEKPYNCKFCGKAFASLNNVKVHERIHTGERPHACQFCGKTFIQVSAKKYHELIHTQDFKYQCKICNRLCLRKADMQRHEQTHSGEKLFQCQYCSKAFSCKRSLMSHEFSHTGEYPFRCAVCNRGFGERKTLRTHERSHTGEKPFKCRYCEKAFAQSGQRTTHERGHTGEKPFKCKICDQSFGFQARLQYHEHVHTGVKNFRCGVCGKGFIQASDFKRHQQIHRRGQPLESEPISKLPSDTEAFGLLQTKEKSDDMSELRVQASNSKLDQQMNKTGPQSATGQIDNISLPPAVEAFVPLLSKDKLDYMKGIIQACDFERRQKLHRTGPSPEPGEVNKTLSASEAQALGPLLSEEHLPVFKHHQQSALPETRPIHKMVIASSSEAEALGSLLGKEKVPAD